MLWGVGSGWVGAGVLDAATAVLLHWGCLACPAVGCMAGRLAAPAAVAVLEVVHGADPHRRCSTALLLR